MIPLPKNFANSNTTPGTRRRRNGTRLEMMGNSVPRSEVARMMNRAARQMRRMQERERGGKS